MPKRRKIRSPCHRGCRMGALAPGQHLTETARSRKARLAQQLSLRSRLLVSMKQQQRCRAGSRPRRQRLGQPSLP